MVHEETLSEERMHFIIDESGKLNESTADFNKEIKLIN